MIIIFLKNYLVSINCCSQTWTLRTTKWNCKESIGIKLTCIFKIWTRFRCNCVFFSTNSDWMVCCFFAAVISRCSSSNSSNAFSLHSNLHWFERENYQFINSNSLSDHTQKFSLQFNIQISNVCCWDCFFFSCKFVFYFIFFFLFVWFNNIWRKRKHCSWLTFTHSVHSIHQK